MMLVNGRGPDRSEPTYRTAIVTGGLVCPAMLNTTGSALPATPEGQAH